jgi:hypothetical protein
MLNAFVRRLLTDSIVPTSGEFGEDERNLAIFPKDVVCILSSRRDSLGWPCHPLRASALGNGYKKGQVLQGRRGLYSERAVCQFFVLKYRLLTCAIERQNNSIQPI